MNRRDIFESVCDYHVNTDRIRVGWLSRYYGERQMVELRGMWGDRSQAEELRRFIDRLVGAVVFAHHEATNDARAAIHALMPIWEREIYRFMEHLERSARRRIEPRYIRYDDRMDTVQWTMAMDPARWWTDNPVEDPKAKEKARQLLLRNLDAGQEKSFKKDGSFRVTAKDGKVYTIKTARSFNVVAEDGTKYCGQTVDTPVEDQMLAQKLLLEHEPEKFFKNANVSPAPGAGATAYDQMIDMVNLRPGAIIRYDRAV
ncbi:MAG TPA: hypothetical protein VF516_03090 [Kofleriaceae bacterium]